MNGDPDFYLASGDGYYLEEPRACWRLKPLRGDHRDDYLLVRVSPPLIGENYRIPVWEFDEVVLAPRYIGRGLLPIVQLPVPVLVAYLKVSDPEHREVIRDEELTLIAWAEVYRTEEEARRGARPPPP
jgi:hypothetical protein